jgi:hypothetical protein
MRAQQESMRLAEPARERGNVELGVEGPGVPPGRGVEDSAGFVRETQRGSCVLPPLISIRREQQVVARVPGFEDPPVVVERPPEDLRAEGIGRYQRIPFPDITL